MKKISKILSVFLALLMVVTIIPMSSITASAEDLETSGTCGENLTWEFDPSTGTLTISGTGAMDDYNLYDHPWEEYREDIKKVIINDGVTSIGCWAFFELPNLERATIPETVTTINDCAFDSCYALKEINIPAGVTTIGVGVFNATSLETITIPNSVTTIGDGAFFGCYSLTDVYYSGTEDEWNNISIDNTYVGNDPLLNATIHFANASNPSGACGENVTWEFDPSTGTLTISGTGAMDDYTITKTPWADYKENIKYGVIDNGVTTIGVGTFNNCTNLISATIPNSVTSIGTAAFSNCSNLSQLSIPDSVTTIGAVAFSGCERLTNITFSDSVTIIGNSAFSHCSSLTSVTIPNSVTTIGDYAFSSCERLASVTIPGSVKYIGELAFYN